MHDLPEFPLEVTFPDGEKLQLDDREHAELNLEWFDSDQQEPEGRTVVLDRRGRRVRLKVERLAIVDCELMDQSPHGAGE